MKLARTIFLGLVWSIVFLFARNLTFMYEEVWTVIGSLGLGLLVHKLPNKLWHLMIFISLSLPLVDFFFLFSESIIPFVLGYLSGRKRQPWKFYLAYILLPLGLVSNWIYSAESYSYSLTNGNSESLALFPLLKLTENEYRLSEDTTYLLSYWHIGCRACLVQDLSLQKLEFRNSNQPLKVISVFLGDSADRRFQPSLKLFHQHFENYIDRNSYVQNQFDQNYGPALMLYKKGKPQKLWRGFTYDSWEQKFKLYYWQWYLDN